MTAQEERICEVVTLPDATPEQVMKVFQDDRYRDRIAVLHFAGHAGPEGLLFETAEGSTAVADAAGLAAFLGCQRGLQLVVLNACATQTHVDALRDAGVGAVVATSRTVEDEIAHQFAVLLYQGLGSGAGIKRAYEEAAAGVRFKHGAVAQGSTAESMHASAAAVTQGTPETPEVTPAVSTPVTRDIRRRNAVTTEDGRWPWDLYFRRGAEESVAPWTLPDAAGNPLFGLPRLPEGDEPLSEPFRHLRPFSRKHAELFFGRGKDIRELYDKVTSSASEPVILLYGATGVGKSSLLDAGLLPRLTSTHEVRYAPRDGSVGLLGTLARELGVDAAGGGEAPAVADAWRALERQGGRPLFVVIDQVEEAYTAEDAGRSAPGAGTKELGAFAAAIARLFASPTDRPRGRLVLGFRKEWLSEVKAALEAQRVARTEHRLEQLTRDGVREAITGPTRVPARRMKTRLEVEPGLDVLIADDLVAKRASHVAPLLQILLATMWTEATPGGGAIRFTPALYEQIQEKSKQLDKFLDEQLAALEQWNPAAVGSGLVLDFLRYYTTVKGSSDEHTLEEEQQRYPHASKPEPGLRTMCARLFLLVEKVDESGAPMAGRPARLAHDTLAPIVRERFERSDRPGPRAKRVLDGRSPEWKDGRKGVPLDQADLAVVEAGEQGMRVWNDEEKALVAASRTERDRAQRRRKALIGGAIAAAVVIAAFGVGSWILYRQSQDRLAESESREFGVRALGGTLDRRDVALLYAAAAHERQPTFEARRALFTQLASHPRLVRVVTTPATDMTFSADGRAIILQEETAFDPVKGPSAGRGRTTLHFMDAERGTIARSVVVADSVLDLQLDPGGATYSGLFGMGAAAGAGGLDSLDTPPVAVGVWSVGDGRRLGGVAPDSTGLEPGAWLVSPPSPTGAIRVASARASVVTVWDVGTGRRMHVLRGPKTSLAPLAFSPDASMLVTVADDGSIIVWDVERGRQVRRVAVAPDRQPSVAIMHDNRALVMSVEDTVTVWPLADGEAGQEHPFTDSNLTAIALGPNDSLLAVNGKDGQVHILRGSLSSAVETLRVSGDVHQAMAFSPKGERLAVLAVGGVLQVWDLGATGFIERTMLAPGLRIAAASADGRYVVTDSGPALLVWNVATRAVTKRMAVALDTTERQMALARQGRPVRRFVGQIVRPQFNVAGVGGSGEVILTAPFDANALFTRVALDAASGRPVGALPGGLSSPATLDPVRARAAYGIPATFAAVVVDLRTNRADTLIAKPGSPNAPVGRPSPYVGFSPDGSLLLVQPYEDAIFVWDLATRRIRETFEAGGNTSGLFASRDGRTLASLAFEEVRFWRSGTAKPIGTLNIALFESNPVALSPDGSLFAYYAGDSVALIDVDRRESLGALRPGSPVVRLAFDSTARLLVVREDGVVDRVETNPSRWAERACAIAASDPARARWRQVAGAVAPLPASCR